MCNCYLREKREAINLSINLYLRKSRGFKQSKKICFLLIQFAFSRKKNTKTELKLVSLLTMIQNKDKN